MSCNALFPDAVKGKEDGDGAIDGDGEREQEEPTTIPQSHAVVDVWTVVVELRHATVAYPAVLGPKWADHPAGVAEPEDIAVMPLPLPLVTVRYLFD